MPCRAHLGEVTASADQFHSLGCDILIVTQARPDVLRGFLARYPQPVPVVGDPDRVAYRAFGLERTSWWTFFRPGVIWRYLKHMLHGVQVRKPYAGEDVRQLGGDFVLTRAGDIPYAFRDPDPTRRPTVAELLKAAAMTNPSSSRPQGAGETALHPHQS